MTSFGYLILINIDHYDLNLSLFCPKCLFQFRRDIYKKKKLKTAFGHISKHLKVSKILCCGLYFQLSSQCLINIYILDESEQCSVLTYQALLCTILLKSVSFKNNSPVDKIYHNTVYSG